MNEAIPNVNETVHDLPPLAVQVIKSLRQTFDKRGSSVFGEDAIKVFHTVGWIIARVCGRDRVVEAMARLEAALEMESLGETSNEKASSVH